jgi:hypothetical protein
MSATAEGVDTTHIDSMVSDTMHCIIIIIIIILLLLLLLLQPVPPMVSPP